MTPQAHVPNIGPRGARRRAMGGIVWSALTVVALIVMLIAGAPPVARAVLAVPVFLAALGFLQAREKT